MVQGEWRLKKIILISCVSKKLLHSAPAQDLYVSPLFRLNLEYARKLAPGAIYILSAMYGLLRLYKSGFTSLYFVWMRKISASGSNPR